MTAEYLNTITPVTDEERGKIVRDLAKISNTPQYNTLKLAEELSELTELLLKQVNKRPQNAPTQEAINEELSDVLLRLTIYVDMKDIDMDALENRALRKLAVIQRIKTEEEVKTNL